MKMKILKPHLPLRKNENKNLMILLNKQEHP